MATELQTSLCRSIIENEFTASNGRKPEADYVFNKSDFVVWSNCLDCSRVKLPVKGKALSGLVSSAMQAGLVKSDGECVWLTEEGYKLAVA